MKAWHFTSDTLRDGRPVPADGVVLRHTGKMVLCQSGLHASPSPFEALQYAPGPHLCLVECGGKIICGTGEQKDKLICSERTIIARMDSTMLLRQFARMQALSVAHLWDAPDVVLDYLMTGDEDIREAAREAARGAAWAGAAAWAAAAARAAAAAGAAARAAAAAAAWAAADAGAAARAAAAAAAWAAADAAAAAWAAADAAARAAAAAAASAAAGAAASAAAGAAARAAAAAAASASFNQSVYECFADYLGERK